MKNLSINYIYNIDSKRKNKEGLLFQVLLPTKNILKTY